MVVAAQAPVRAQSLPKISVVTVPSDSLCSPLYGKAEGFFANAGLDADVRIMPNGVAVLSAVAAGAIDIGGANLMSLVQAFAKGVPVKMIAPAGLYDGTSPVVAIVVAKDSPYKTMRDLEGKTVAVPALRSIGDFASKLALEKTGGDATKMQTIEVALSEMEAAVLSGRVAAAAIAEPYLTQTKATLRILAEPYAAIAPRFFTSAFFASNQWLAAHPDLAADFMSAMRATAVWSNKNRAKTAQILAGELKLDPGVAQTMTRINYGQVSTAALIQPNIDLLLKFKQLDGPVSAQSMIYQPSK
jgi:NitT/TauT family transport system substrate-binding protein